MARPFALGEGIVIDSNQPSYKAQVEALARLQAVRSVFQSRGELADPSVPIADTSVPIWDTEAGPLEGSTSFEVVEQEEK